WEEGANPVSSRVALRSLAGHHVPSRDRTDRPQPLINLSLSGQSILPSKSTDDVTPQLEQELARSLAAALYIEESAIDVEKPFVDMGLDSVVGVEWIRALNQRYASKLKASSVYDYPTIHQLAGFLQKEWLQHRQTPL